MIHLTRPNAVSKTPHFAPPARRRRDYFDVQTQMPHSPAAETCTYVRMSTSRTELSEVTQIAQCEEYHARESLPPLSRYAFIDEAVSGNKPIAKRKMGGRLMQYLRRGDHLIVSTFDRLGRNMLDSISTLRDLVERGVYVHCLNLQFLAKADPNDPTTRLILAQYAAFAEFEWNSAGRRFSTARLNALWSGKGNYKHSIPAFFDRIPNKDGDGFDWKYRFNRDVFDLYDVIYQRYHEGWSLREIARALNNGEHYRPVTVEQQDGSRITSTGSDRWNIVGVRHAVGCVTECRKVNKWNPSDAKYTLGST